MAWSLPSLPSLPTSAPGASAAPVAVLNGVSLLAKFLPDLNPPRPVYAIINAETGIPLTVPDSWGEAIVRWADYQTTDYPVEGGGFITANKVRRPASVDLVLVKTGSDLARMSWLEAVRQQLDQDPLARYHVVTPNGIFQSLTLTGSAFQTRPDRGQNMLYLEVRFTEVPQIRTPSLTGQNAVDPESGPVAVLGRVFPQNVTSAVRALAGPMGA